MIHNRTNARTPSVFDLRMLQNLKAAPINHAVLLRLEGRVVGPWVTELQKSCDEVLVEGRSLKLTSPTLSSWTRRASHCFRTFGHAALCSWNVPPLRQNS